MTLRSAIYEGPVVHERVRPKHHRLRYNVYSLLLDLDELPALGRRFKLFGYNRRAPLAFYDRDHGPTTGEPLRPWVEARLAEAGIEPDGGPIRLLCYPRVFGYAFNPLSVFFCYRLNGQLTAILYEVCNTFRERHTYVIPVTETPRAVIRQSCGKSFYVSPFMQMDSDYHFRIIPPGLGINIVIRQEDADGLLFAASFRGKRIGLTGRSLARCLFRFPMLSLKIITGIHWEALRLWLKGVPVVSHTPAPAPVQSSVGRSAPTRP
jgi:DUF1365 family protein